MTDKPKNKQPTRRTASGTLRLPAPSIGVESYMHRAAKEVLAGWLREVAAERGHDNYTNLGPITWRVNRPGPNWGVYLEYPFPAAENAIDTVWDEHGDRFKAGPPTMEWCQQQGIKIACVSDIVVQHKGQPAYAVEVVHRHPCPDHKREFYASRGTWLVEVKADWVLKQVRRPDALMGSTSQPDVPASPTGGFSLMRSRG